MAEEKSSPDFQFIDRANQLDALVAALDAEPDVAIDTEADNLFHYQTRVCLLQVLANGRIFLVDLLRDLPLAPIWDRLGKRLLVMHGSDYDLRLLAETYDFVPTRLFDTMLASQLLNLPRIGLANLLDQYFGVQLSKESQKSNWSRRPLTPKMLTYAALDVQYLPALRDILEGRLRELRRIEWLEQKCAWQIQAGSAGFGDEDTNAWRIGRSEQLSPRGLAVLYEVWNWRERQAERLDRPPFKVVMNEVLLRLAHAGDRETPPDEAFADLRLGRRANLARSLQRAYEAGLRRNPETLPRRPSRGRRAPPLNSDELARQDQLKAVRDGAARRLSLDPTLIASRAQLAQLARAPSSANEVLLPWQRDLLLNGDNEG